MEINPLSRVQEVEPFGDKKKQNPYSKQEAVLAISKELGGSLAKLIDWIEKYPQNPQEMGIILADLIEIAESYDEAKKTLESFKNSTQDIDRIQNAMEIETNLENAFKKIGKLTLAPYWKYGDFSFIFLFSIAHHVPQIDLKPMILHLFEKLSLDQWKQTQDILQFLINQLS